ncbi:hypothetical protein ACS5PN_07450 [Roseateles sp. NT4]|uniref:hypothetical protein n=1 Tax=Roseateles sp. NT4 TaxID=3453715 RepID=UPI003EEA55E1
MTKRHVLAGLALVLATSAALAGDGKDFSMGIQGNARTEAADVGLPVYAGAVPVKDSADDKAGISFGAWAGGFGLQIHAMKFHSAASPERVAAFYVKALGRYGAVLDCRDPANRIKPPKDSDRLSCEASELKPGTLEYRVGTAKSFHVVSVKPEGEGSRLDMASIDLRF